jgi:hypothetical protein
MQLKCGVDRRRQVRARTLDVASDQATVLKSRFPQKRRI